MHYGQQKTTQLRFIIFWKPRLFIFTTMSCNSPSWYPPFKLSLWKKPEYPEKPYDDFANFSNRISTILSQAKSVFRGNRSTRTIPTSSKSVEKIFSKSTKRSTNLLTGTICTLYAVDTICTQYVILHKKNYASFSTQVKFRSYPHATYTNILVM